MPSFFAKVIPDAESKRLIPAAEDEMIVIDPKMMQLIKAFRVTRTGSKRGGLHLLKKSSKKRRRTEFATSHSLSQTIKEAMRAPTEKDVFKRVRLQQNFVRRD